MKSKLVMLMSIGVLALTASAPFAMASGKAVTASARGPVAVSKSAKANARSATVKRSASRTALPQPHTILNGAKNNF